MNLTSSPHPPDSLNRLRRSEVVARDLQTKITSGQLPVGCKLPTETKLCQQYQVSRTTLREAIQVLRSAGLLDVAPGRGSYVRAPHLGQLLGSLQLALQQRAPQPYEVINLQGWALQQVAAQLAQQPHILRPALADLAANRVEPDRPAPENLRREETWLRLLVQAAQLPLTQLVLDLTSGLLAPHRLAALQHPPRVVELNQLQQRAVAALMASDAPLAARLLVTCFRLPPSNGQLAA